MHKTLSAIADENNNLLFRCLALNNSELKHQNLLSLSVLKKVVHFQSVELMKFLVCPVNLNMCTITGMTHNKAIFMLIFSNFVRIFISIYTRLVSLLFTCVKHALSEKQTLSSNGSLSVWKSIYNSK